MGRDGLDPREQQGHEPRDGGDGRPGRQALPDLRAGALTPRLLATDVDGTLLRPDGTVSPRVRAAIAAAQAGGLQVVLATARPVRVVRPLAAALGLGGHAICLGGAQRFDLDAGELVGEDRLDHETATAVLGALRAAHPDVLVVAEVGLDIHVEHGFSLGAWGFADLAHHTVRGSLAELDPGVTALLAGHAHVPLDELELVASAAGGPRAAVTQSGGPHIEVFAAGVSKASGLAALCADLGVGREEVVAIGDNRNDVEMVRWAGRGVAVANAVPELLAAADDVVPANTEDGVAVLVEGLLGGLPEPLG